MVSRGELLSTVIRGRYCIGCGICAAMDPALEIRMDQDGFYQAQLRRDARPEPGEGGAVCPFARQSDAEDRLAEKRFSPYGAPVEKHLGRVLQTYAGYVAEGDFRRRGGSGGLTKWLLAELVKQNWVDQVVQVEPCRVHRKGAPFFRYAIHRSVDEILGGSKSAYHPVEMSEVLQRIKTQPGRYAIAGLPCFIKGLQMLAQEQPEWGDRLVWYVGLVCGHLKSIQYAQLLGWQLGVTPERLETIDFRAKLPATKANEKGVTVTGLGDSGEKIEKSATVQHLFGTDYGAGFFKYKACDYCDDVVAELADISLGDAWLPRYVQDGQGTNLVLVRDPRLQELLETARREGRLHLEPITREEAVVSQDAGFRHRREGLAYRLWLSDRKKQWRPPRRVVADKNACEEQVQRIQDLRITIREESRRYFNKALQKNSLDAFMRPLLQLIRQYHRVRKGESSKRIADWMQSGLALVVRAKNRFIAK